MDGKAYLEKMIDTYGDITLTEAEDGSWRNRKKSYLVKKMLSERKNLRRKDLGAYLGCPIGTMDYKFNKDSFSFDDIVAIAYACDYEIIFRDKVGKQNILINAIDWFRNYDNDMLNRLKELKDGSPMNLKHAEYEKKKTELEKKKAELEKMKEEYGFDD